MTKMFLCYVIILLVFTAIDMAWLMGVARSTYVLEMGALLKKQPNLIAAIVFYLLYALGILIFAVRPGVESASWTTAMGFGAALGLVAYGTYDLTNLSVVEGFGTRIAFIDLAWGTVLSATTSAVATFIALRLP